MKSMKLILESWRTKSLEEKQKSTEKYDDHKDLKKAGGDPEEEEKEKVKEANEGGEGVHDILNLPEPEAVDPSGDPKVDALRQIVADKQFAKVDGVDIDLTTANLLLQIIDALSPTNRENFLSKPIEQMVNIAYKILGK